MKQVDEARMKDVKAAIAANAADLLPKAERPSGIAALLRCDETEARELIARGRRLARQKTERA